MEKNGASKEDTSENSAFLTYLLANFSPDEAIGHALDVITGAVETVRKGYLKFCC